MDNISDNQGIIVKPSETNSHNQSPGLGHNHLLTDRLIGNVEYAPPDQLRAARRVTRIHPKKQIAKLCASIEEFGFLMPILIDEESSVIAGHARLKAAKELGYTEVPVIRVIHLSKAQKKAFRIADNKLPELAVWDHEALVPELQELLEIDFNIELTGFDVPEIDLMIERQDGPVGLSPADALQSSQDGGPPVTQLGDLWVLDEHRFICGDARDPTAYEAVLDGSLAQMIITDAPYNVLIDGNATGSGNIHHREFPMASGEMSETEFTAFIVEFIQNLIRFSADGSVHYLFMDWRHIAQLLSVCDDHYTKQLNLCVWVKTNGGMGSLYRSQHELIAVYRNGEAAHINNVRLGKYGRNRTNAWHYEGVNTLNPERRQELVLHPTVKPAALVADAIRDCSKRGGIILDPFIGSGTTIIASEQTGRRCCGIELDPLYVDLAIHRWEQFTGGKARHAKTGLTFAETETVRHSPVLLLPPPKPADPGKGA